MTGSRSFTDSKVVLGMGTEPVSGSPIPDPETPFRILLMGNFRGQSQSESSGLAKRRPIMVDRDNFDEVLARFGLSIHLPPAEEGQAPIAISFQELDDFHPDFLFRRLDVFAELKDLRRKLMDPQSFADAAAQLQTWMTPTATEKTPAPESDPSQETQESTVAADISPEQLLDQILADQSDRPPPREPSEWQQYLRKLVEPHTTPKIEQDQEHWLEFVDTLTGNLMRYILHAPNLQELESTWRAVDFLVRRLETGTSLQLYLLDISKQELADELKTEDLSTTEIFKIVVEQAVQTSGGLPWSVLIGHYTFDKTEEDARWLQQMAQIAGQAGAPFLAAAHPHTFGCPSLVEHTEPREWTKTASPKQEEAWKNLRKSPPASFLGLAAPRFLLRLPYGKETSETEDFAFEEMPSGSAHSDYLWGNPAFLCGYLLGQSFSKAGWHMRPGVMNQVDDLPLHVYKEDGESCVKPCAEVLLIDRAVDAILDQGIIPLVSVLNRNVVQVARFQSLAEPVSGLAGRWG